MKEKKWTLINSLMKIPEIKLMKKLIAIFKFIGSADLMLDSVLIVLYILRAIYEIPAFIFHELMHIMWLWLCWDIKIEVWKWFDIVNDGRTLKPFSLKISYTSNSDVGKLTSFMPMMGWIIAVIVLAFTSHFFVLAYFITAFRTFYLSATDIEALETNGVSPRICNALLTINKNII